MRDSKYTTEIQYPMIPDDVWFWLPERNQGQIVEVSYGDHGLGQHDSGAPYCRVIDWSLHFTHPGRVTYYKRDGT